MNRKNNKRKGFTIVELVIVIAVIGILAGVMIPTFGGVIDKANKSNRGNLAKNAYTAYLTENAANVEDIYIVVEDDYYYAVADRELDIDNELEVTDTLLNGWTLKYDNSDADTANDLADLNEDVKIYIATPANPNP